MFRVGLSLKTKINSSSRNLWQFYSWTLRREALLAEVLVASSQSESLQNLSARNSNLFGALQKPRLFRNASTVVWDRSDTLMQLLGEMWRLLARFSKMQPRNEILMLEKRFCLFTESGSGGLFSRKLPEDHRASYWRQINDIPLNFYQSRWQHVIWINWSSLQC